MSEKIKNLDDTTKVVDYFKQHEGLFIATVSAIVTAITIIISFLAYVYQKIILQEYKVPLDIINTLNHGRLFYYVLMSMCIFAINPLIQSILTSTFLQHYRKVAINKIFRIHLHDEEDENHRDAFNHYLDKDRRQYIKSLFLSILAICFLFLVLYIIYIIATGSFDITMIISWAVISMINLVTAKRHAIKQAGEYAPKKIDKLVEKIESEPDQEKRITGWRQHFENLVDLTLDETYKKKYTSDGKVLEYILSMALSVVAVTVFVIISAYAEAKTQNSYWIFQNADKQYAVIYQNPEVFVLEEAIIQDDNIIIIRNQQRYLKFEDVEVEKRQFRHVEIIDKPEKNEILYTEGITVDL